MSIGFAYVWFYKGWFQSRMASVETDVYTKPTDKHQYLLIFSCHSHHTKCSIPYSLALRLCHICSSHDSYIQRTDELINYLIYCGYDKTFPTTQIQHASDVPRADILKDKPPTRTETTPFVITCNPTALPMSSTPQNIVEMFLKTLQ